MSAYEFVPKVASASDTIENGVIAVSRTYIGDYRIGYTSSSEVGIRYCFSNEDGTEFNIELAVNATTAAFTVYLIGPTGTTIGSASSTSFRSTTSINGFTYSLPLGFLYDNGQMTTSTEVYDTVSSAQQAMRYDDTPSQQSGIVVTAVASPIYVPPVSDGIIVTAIATLLDANEQGGTSTPGGGTGIFDESSDVIPIPALPTLSAADSGLIALFRPTKSELNSLGAYLWTNITDFIENLQKMFSNPMDYFVAFHIVPCMPPVGPSRNIKLGLWTTSISMPPVLSQWYEHNCGTITLPEYWGSALDYSPNTKVSLFLPFIGSVQLNTDEVMNQRINVTYRIDLLSGQCVAMVTSTSPVDKAGSVVYQYTGECSVSVPLTGADWSRVYAAGIGAVGTAITGGVGIAGASSAVNNAASAARTAEATATGPAGQRLVQNAASHVSEARSLRASRIANTVNNTVGSVMGGKQSVVHSGSITGSAGMLGVKTPYLIVEYPNQSLAKDYRHFVGYPSNMYAKLGTLSGYTECEQVIPNSSYLSMNDSEMAELMDTLKGGVYLNFNNLTRKGTGITLYQYGGPSNTVGKGAKVVDTLTGTFRDATSVSSPTFTIERNSPVGFNYVYIEAFDRFYYVTGVSADMHSIVTVSCTVDVLETAGASLKEFEAVVKRQENEYNLYLDDGIFKAYQNTKHKIIAFPNPFTDYSYILAIAGNSDDS